MKDPALGFLIESKAIHCAHRQLPHLFEAWSLEARIPNREQAQKPCPPCHWWRHWQWHSPQNQKECKTGWTTENLMTLHGGGPQPLLAAHTSVAIKPRGVLFASGIGIPFLLDIVTCPLFLLPWGNTVSDLFLDNRSWRKDADPDFHAPQPFWMWETWTLSTSSW